MTLLRLWLRRGRYWWDDAWAFFSLLKYVVPTHRIAPLHTLIAIVSSVSTSLIVQFGAVFMHVEHPKDLSRLDRIAAYYLMAVTFYTVIWSARISILFSIIRIDPDPIMRQRLKWLAAAFLAAVGGLFFQLFWTCEHIHGWKNKTSPQCPLPKQVAIFQLISACSTHLVFFVLLKPPSPS
jgi:glucan phosphoethanolaminetransferase (alkaline phosphatase superfamily)